MIKPPLKRSCKTGLKIGVVSPFSSVVPLQPTPNTCGDRTAGPAKDESAQTWIETGEGREEFQNMSDVSKLD